MSVATVKAHVSRLLVKLGVENRVQVALLVQAPLANARAAADCRPDARAEARAAGG